MDGDERRAREAGCDAFLTKPVDLDELESMINNYLVTS
jgi:CheY-like chemotaxis protein